MIISFAIPSLMLAFCCVAYLYERKVNDGLSDTQWNSVILLTIIPGLIFILLYASLATHIYFSLGRSWPKSLGTAGFSNELMTHTDITFTYFECFLIFGLFVWPVLVIVFFVVTKARKGLPMIIASGLSFWVFIPWMFLAPRPFQNWWWD